MTKVIAVIAVLVTTCAIADSPHPKPTTEGRQRIQHTWNLPDWLRRQQQFMRGTPQRHPSSDKVSGACTLSREPYPFPDIWNPLARVFDAWGFDRCLWGIDWTRAFAVVNYAQAVEPFLQTARLSATERAMLMGGACARAYGWSPNKALLTADHGEADQAMGRSLS